MNRLQLLAVVHHRDVVQAELGGAKVLDVPRGRPGANGRRVPEIFAAQDFGTLHVRRGSVRR